MSEASVRLPLRDRLLALRADLLHQLDGADVLEPGWLNSLAGIAAALELTALRAVTLAGRLLDAASRRLG